MKNNGLIKMKTLFVIITLLVTTNLWAESVDLKYYRSKELYNQGAAHCQKLLLKTTDKQKRKEILIELAACYHFNTRDQTYQEAVETYQQLIKEYPSDPLCARFYFYIGRCYDAFSRNRPQDIDKAHKAYRACFEKYPESQWADQAYLWLANSYIFKSSIKNAKMSAETFEGFLKRYPKSMLVGIAHSQLSELYCAWLKDYVATVKHSEAALAWGIENVNLRRLHLYRLGYVYQYKLNNIPKSLQWYKQLITESPTQSDPNYFVVVKRVRELEAELEGAK
ncbi:MAG: tetratricopeptide repeat protein [Phycisphaeraceae bacterium]|nr:tetratricopeptide repeat protein [Phycisphaeraceae bacterium]